MLVRWRADSGRSPPSVNAAVTGPVSAASGETKAAGWVAPGSCGVANGGRAWCGRPGGLMACSRWVGAVRRQRRYCLHATER